MNLSTSSTSPLLQTKSYRIDAIDLLRGLVMIIMALDHTRDFFHKPAWTEDPLNLETTTPILYFTRWVTHLCAPIFVFLAGTGAYFQSQRKSKKDLSLFLIKRGLWLLIVEILIINFAFSFDIHYSVIGLQTIWSIGISMIILGLVIWLPFPVILVLGSLIVLGHNLLDYFETPGKPPQGWFYHLMHQPTVYPLWDGHSIFILYPFLPWAGLMMMGYCFGKLFLKYEGAQRKKVLLLIALGLFLLFAVLRIPNIYGDPGAWIKQKNALYSFLDIMDVQKYPPSLLYMCATIGIGLVILALIGNARNRLTKFIIVYGRVPFLYYVLHFFLIHLVSGILYLTRGHSVADGVAPKEFLQPNFTAPNEGYSLFLVYIIWILIVVSLYPVCKWFSEYKRKHKDWWLSYI
jgi:uncharacterized membrane protein